MGGSDGGMTDYISLSWSELIDRLEDFTEALYVKQGFAEELEPRHVERVKGIVVKLQEWIEDVSEWLCGVSQPSQL